MHFGQFIFLFLAALISGVLNSVAGGGSFVSFPALLFLQIPGVQANATNTVALWPGLAASSAAYWKRLNVPQQLLTPLVLTSAAGGLAGALLLVKTPQRTFLHLVPWLLLGGTLLFIFGDRIRTFGRRSEEADDDLGQASWRAIAVISFLEMLVGVYGGYFGAGIGFMMLGMLATLGMRDIHAMSAVRTLLATVINAVAVVTFILARAVYWHQCAVMVAGALLGGWFGAHYAQKVDPRKVRYAVILVGFAMTAYFFVTTR